MNIRKISIDNKSDLEFMEKLYIESFPPNERRPVLGMQHLIEENKIFNACILTDDTNTRLGFLNYWIFDTFIYLEHFAISPEQRSGGNGRKAVELLINNTNLPLLAEIELPSTSDFAKRRLKFYENLGFRVWDFPYEQPPYEAGYEPIPMLLLTYRELDLHKTIDIVRNQLYKEVYGKNAM